MSPRVTVRHRAREPRFLRLGPFRLWAVRIPQGPNLGVGRIATTDTPSNPAPGQRYMQDGSGWVVVIADVAFAALRCRSVPVRPQHP